MLLAAAAVALPMEGQGGNPSLTPASTIHTDARTRAEQLINEGKEMWNGAVKAAGGLSGGATDMSKALLGIFSLGSSELTVPPSLETTVMRPGSIKPASGRGVAPPATQQQEHPAHEQMQQQLQQQQLGLQRQQQELQWQRHQQQEQEQQQLQQQQLGLQRQQQELQWQLLQQQQQQQQQEEQRQRPQWPQRHEREYEHGQQQGQQPLPLPQQQQQQELLPQQQEQQQQQKQLPWQRVKQFTQPRQEQPPPLPQQQEQQQQQHEEQQRFDPLPVPLNVSQRHGSTVDNSEQQQSSPLKTLTRAEPSQQQQQQQQQIVAEPCQDDAECLRRRYGAKVVTGSDTSQDASAHPDALATSKTATDSRMAEEAPVGSAKAKPEAEVVDHKLLRRSLEKHRPPKDMKWLDIALISVGGTLSFVLVMIGCFFGCRSTCQKEMAACDKVDVGRQVTANMVPPGGYTC